MDHARSAKRDHLSFRPLIPGPALMELLHRVVKAEDSSASIINGNLMVEVRNLDTLIAIFCVTPSRFDLRHEGY